VFPPKSAHEDKRIPTSILLRADEVIE